MALENIQKAIDLIEKSEHIAIFLPQDAGLDRLAAAEVFTSALEDHGKQVSFVSKPALSPGWTDIFKKISAGGTPPKEFVVSLDTVRSPTLQLRYEKLEDRIDVIFSPKSLPIKKEDVSFREGRSLCDCAVMLGISDLDLFEGADAAAPEFFTETPIINIDNSEKNKNYGEANVVDISRPSLSEIVYGFSSAFSPQTLNKDIASLLLLGIVNETDNLRSGRADADTLLAASELVRLGGERMFLRDVSASLPAHSLSLLQFFGRAITRTKSDESGQMVWSFLTREDFEKTGRTPADILQTAEYLSAHLPSRKILILLWQDTSADEIKSLLASEPQALEAISLRETGEIKKSGYLQLTVSFSSFRAAESYLGSLLAEIF